MGAGLFVLVAGILLGWKYIIKPHQVSPISSSPTTLTAEKKGAGSFSFSGSPDLGDPLLAKIINGVGEGRGEQDFTLEAMVSPGVGLSTLSGGVLSLVRQGTTLSAVFPHLSDPCLRAFTGIQQSGQ